MSASPLSNEIALRIALAARELPDVNAAKLLAVLDDAIGLPPTTEKLSSLTVKSLMKAKEDEFSDIDVANIKSALSILKGENETEQEVLPEIFPYQENEMPNSIRVAFASNNGEKLDGHFGSCSRFLIYQVSKDERRLIAIRDTNDKNIANNSDTGVAEDKNVFRTSLINDCQILFVVSIGGPAAAKVIRAGIHPIKKAQICLASEEISSLQKIISQNPPPWLAKIMGHSPEQRIRFEQQIAD